MGMNGSWGSYLTSPADFAGADDIITNLAKEKVPVHLTVYILPEPGTASPRIAVSAVSL